MVLEISHFVWEACECGKSKSTNQCLTRTSYCPPYSLFSLLDSPLAYSPFLFCFWPPPTSSSAAGEIMLTVNKSHLSLSRTTSPVPSAQCFVPLTSLKFWKDPNHP